MAATNIDGAFIESIQRETADKPPALVQAWNVSLCVCASVRLCPCARARDGPLALGAASKWLHVLRLRVGFGRQLPVRGDRDADARGRSARAGAPRPLAQIPMSGMACVGVIMCVGTCV
jgi:hypothetical protein